MRFLHTADWHLGRLFHGLHLTDDQAVVLQQIVQLTRDCRPDALLIAGDLFDRAVPPPEAVDLLDDVLNTLILELKVPVVAIAGNHDSSVRLEFAAGVLRRQGLHVVGSPTNPVTTVTFDTAAGDVLVHAIPYAEPAVLRTCLNAPDVCDHQTGMQAVVASVHKTYNGHPRQILMGHGTVLGGEGCESERPLSVGGAYTVDPACFAGFAYVALGHLHRPQTLGDEGQIHYAGSLMKYSFSEAAHHKTVSLVEMDKDGRCHVEKIPLKARHDVRCLRGTLADLLRGPQDGLSAEDYVHVVLEDTGAILDPIGKLRQVYPNVMSLERSETTLGSGSAARMDHRRVSDAMLFASFYREVTGESLTEDQAAAYANVVDAMHQSAREA
jgi:exonuclease SbcD